MGGYFCINAFGRIERGDDQRFIKFLTEVAPPPRTVLYINSMGGDVDAALEIGRIVRSSWFSTSVGTYTLESSGAEREIVSRVLSPGQCMSAATLVFLGGRLRFLPQGSSFGVHQFSYRDPTPASISESQVLSARIAGFIVEMGVSTEFLKISSATLNADLRIISEKELRDLRIVTGGITDVTWTVQASGDILYVRGERDCIYGHHKVMFGYSRRFGFVFWAVIEALGRERELMTHGLVEIVINGESERIDISSRCGREVIGNYVNIISAISEEEAKKCLLRELWRASEIL